MKSVYTGWCFLIAAGATVTVAAAERPAFSDVSVSEEHAVDGGSWRYIVRRSSQAFGCDSGNGSKGSCVEHVVVVENKSPRTLECAIRVDYIAPDGTHGRNFVSPAVILPRTSPGIHGDTVTSDAKLNLAELNCTARAPHPRLPKQAGCEIEMRGNPLADYYPVGAIRNGFEGPVLVSFRLPKQNGHAAEIDVAESSLIPSLDAAAKKFIAEQVFTTPCAGSRYDLRIRFNLRDLLNRK